MPKETSKKKTNKIEVTYRKKYFESSPSITQPSKMLAQLSYNRQVNKIIMSFPTHYFVAWPRDDLPVSSNQATQVILDAQITISKQHLMER